MFSPDQSLVPPHQKIVAAVSGGADSVALLVWLHQIGREVVVGHVNHDLHELRSGDCERDEAFVRELGKKLGFDIRVARVHLERRSGHVHEATARQARYESLLQIAREENCSLVATAHSATDALETALLNLGRGGGPNAFVALTPQRELGDGVQLVRPLWSCGRDSIRAWLREQNVAWREDESNQSPLFRRNRVRHEVLPRLGDICERDLDALSEQFARNAAFARDEAQFLEEQALRFIEAATLKCKPDLLVLDGLALRDAHPALARRVLRLAARGVVSEAREIEGHKIEITRIAVVENARRTVWMWRRDLRVEWTGTASGNRIRLARVEN